MLVSPAERDFAFIIGRRALRDSLEGYKDRPKYQRLVIDFNYGEDPDDAYSSIPYEKGANLILHLGAAAHVQIVTHVINSNTFLLERTLGGLDVFLPYIKEYVNTFTGKSISYLQWKDHLYDYYRRHHPEKVKLLDSIDWQACFILPILTIFLTPLQAWFFGEGTELPVKMEYDTTLVSQAYDLAAKWDESRHEDTSKLKFSSKDLANLNANQIGEFASPT